MRELIVDEILLYHSKEAREYYDKCKTKYPKGVLEILYQRVGAPQNTSGVKLPAVDTSAAMEEVDTQGSSSQNSTPENDSAKKRPDVMGSVISSANTSAVSASQNFSAAYSVTA